MNEAADRAAKAAKEARDAAEEGAATADQANNPTGEPTARPTPSVIPQAPRERDANSMAEEGLSTLIPSAEEAAKTAPPKGTLSPGAAAGDRKPLPITNSKLENSRPTPSPTPTSAPGIAKIEIEDLRYEPKVGCKLYTMLDGKYSPESESSIPKAQARPHPRTSETHGLPNFSV